MSHLILPSHSWLMIPLLSFCFMTLYSLSLSLLFHLFLDSFFFTTLRTRLEFYSLVCREHEHRNESEREIWNKKKEWEKERERLSVNQVSCCAHWFKGLFIVRDSKFTLLRASFFQFVQFSVSRFFFVSKKSGKERKRTGTSHYFFLLVVNNILHVSSWMRLSSTLT